MIFLLFWKTSMVLGVMLMSTSVLVQGPFVTSVWTARSSLLSLVFDSGCLIHCLSFLVISVTFAVFSFVLWFSSCPCYILFCFVLPPNQSRTDLFCRVFQNNKNSSSCRGWVGVLITALTRLGTRQNKNHKLTYLGLTQKDTHFASFPDSLSRHPLLPLRVPIYLQALFFWNISRERQSKWNR